MKGKKYMKVLAYIVFGIVAVFAIGILLAILMALYVILKDY